MQHVSVRHVMSVKNGCIDSDESQLNTQRLKIRIEQTGSAHRISLGPSAPASQFR